MHEEPFLHKDTDNLGPRNKFADAQDSNVAVVYIAVTGCLRLRGMVPD